MAASDHKELEPFGKFCGVPGCKHNDYQKVCKPTWSSLKYPQRQFNKETQKPYTIQKSYEAHHLLCVAQINGVVIAEGQERGLGEIVSATEWCINKKENMLGMPMWGHTVMWYCNGFKSIVKSTLGQVGAVLSERTKAPPFKDLPQHNFGHSGRTLPTSYNREVGARLLRIINAIEKSKSEHTEKIAELISQLNATSELMRTTLKERGVRSGGTHTCWLNSPPLWYAPFSMAQTARPIPHPKDGGEEMIWKIQNLAKALWG
jgi:hypothetical protein